MLEIKRSNGQCYIKAEGGTKEIACDIVTVISDIYSGLQKASPINAALFRAMVTECITNPRCPTWRQNHDGRVEIVIPIKEEK